MAGKLTVPDDVMSANKLRLIEALRYYQTVLKDIRFGDFDLLEEQLTQQNDGISLRDPIVLLEGLTEF